MIQQVNLYKDILEQGQKRSSRLGYSVVLGALCLTAIGVSIYQFWQVQSLAQQVQQQEAELATVEERVNQLLASMPSQAIDAKLAADVELWQKGLHSLKAINHSLSSQGDGKKAGFSGYFQVLAEQSIPEVWLTRITINKQQSLFELEGSTVVAGKVPGFLQRVQQQPVFAGQAFASLMMEPSEQVPTQLDFKLSSRNVATENN